MSFLGGGQGIAGRVVAGLFALLTLLGAAVAPSPAFAHAALVKADPADGALLMQAPKTFSLTFSEPVSPLVLKLVRPDGISVPLTGYRIAGQTLEIEAPRPLQQGTHVLNWRVISADGHPVGGSLLFSFGAASVPPGAAEPVDWGLRAAIWAARVFFYIGLFLGVGGAFAIGWMAGAGRAGAGMAAAMMLGGIVAAGASLGLQGLDALGAPLAQFARPAVWLAALDTSYGWTVLAGLAALGCGLLALAFPGAGKPLAALGLAGVGTALAASGHASAAEPQWLTRPMVWLHGACIALWTGALIPLGLALKRRQAGAGLFLRRFSNAIPFGVGVLAAAGIVIAVIQVRTPAALVATAYGRLLLVKLALVAALLALAAVNRWRLTAPAASGGGAARKKLVRSVGAEVLVVLAIFGVAAGWRFTPPPRALAIAAARPVSIHIHTAKAMADLSLAPGRVGDVSASIVIMTGDFGPLDAKGVTLVLSKPDLDIVSMKRPAKKSDDGIWRIDDLVIPVAGRWTARLDILITDFDMVKIEGPIDIRP